MLPMAVILVVMLIAIAVVVSAMRVWTIGSTKGKQWGSEEEAYKETHIDQCGGTCRVEKVLHLVRRASQANIPRKRSSNFELSEACKTMKLFNASGDGSHDCIVV
jgi:hypothetical protein